MEKKKSIYRERKRAKDRRHCAHRKIRGDIGGDSRPGGSGGTAQRIYCSFS